MKKSVTHFFTSLAVFSLMMTYSVSITHQAQAQIINCPAGYTCTPKVPVSSNLTGSQICPSFSTYLGIGSSGQDVVTLQSFLISNGFDIPSISASRTQKGYFGQQTSKALSLYQNKVGLTVTGALDSATMAKLNSGGCMQYKSPTPAGNQTNSAGTPTINSLSTNSATPGTAVQIYVSKVPQGRQYLVWLSSTPQGSVNPGTLSSDGSYLTFTVPKLPAGQYSLYFGYGTGAVVGSNAVPFTVLDASSNSYQGSITVISPNGGQSIATGQSVVIQWSTQNIPANATMNINLANENGVVGQIATGLNPNINQSYSWNTASPIGTISTISGLVPEYIYPGQYKIDLEVSIPVPVTEDNQKGMIGVADLSDNYFTVTDSSGNLPVASVLNSISLSSIPNDGITTATISGSGFNSSSAVYFSGPVYRYAYKTIPSSVSTQSLTFAIAQNFPPAGQYQLTVSNDGIAMSNSLNVTVTAASPTTPVPVPVTPLPSNSIITSIVGPNGGFWANNSAGIWTVYISDPNSSSISVTADWGDGSPSGSGSVNGSNGSVQVSHQYKASGTYTITFTAKDSNGLTAQKTLTQQVW